MASHKKLGSKSARYADRVDEYCRMRMSAALAVVVVAGWTCAKQSKNKSRYRRESEDVQCALRSRSLSSHR